LERPVHVVSEQGLNPKLRIEEEEDLLLKNIQTLLLAQSLMRNGLVIKHKKNISPSLWALEYYEGILKGVPKVFYHVCGLDREKELNIFWSFET
jgi:hypothetical protein